MYTMPLIHIYLNEGKSKEYRSAVSDALHEAFLRRPGISRSRTASTYSIHETKPD